MLQRSRAIPPAEKAAFHNVTGAGRSQVKREFFSLSEADADALVERLDERLDERLRKRSQ
jgi:hypothetical protein